MCKTIPILGAIITTLVLAGGAIAQSQNGLPMLAPVEERVLSSNIVTLGTARYGLPQSISVGVIPGLSADGFVEVNPVDGTLAEGQLVVVGYKNPANTMDLEPK